MADGDQPKIIVDDDWKSQAQAEKARLAAKAAEEAATKQAPGDGGEGGEGGLPEQIGFIDLVRMLATQALMYMGAFPDPQTGKAVVSLEVARLNVDLLEVLHEKTKGNLDDEETKTLEGTLHELRVQFVEIAKAIQQAQAEGRIGPDGTMQAPADPGAGGPGGPGTGPSAGGPFGGAGGGSGGGFTGPGL